MPVAVETSRSALTSHIVVDTLSNSYIHSLPCAKSWVAQFYLLGGILFGALIAIALAIRRHVHTRQVLTRQRQIECGSGPESRNSISVYMNIFLTNKDEVVHKTVLEKVPHGVFGVVQKLASKVATKLVSNQSVAQKVGDIIAVAVPRKLETRKLKANAKCIYVQGGLAVVKVNVTDIDLLGVIARKLPDKRMDQVRSVYHCWNRCGTSSGNADEIPFHLLKQRAENAFRAEVWAQIESRVVSSLGGQIEAKLWNEAGVEAIVVSKAEHKQAKFFFDLLSSMNTSKSRSGVTKFRKSRGHHQRTLTPSMASALPILMRERGPRLPQTMMDPDQLFTAASKFLSRSKNAETVYKRLRYRQREGEIESATTMCKLFSALHNRATNTLAQTEIGKHNVHSDIKEVSSKLPCKNLPPMLRNVQNMSIAEAKKEYVVMLGDLMPEWTKSLARQDPNNAGSQRQNELVKLSKRLELNEISENNGSNMKLPSTHPKKGKASELDENESNQNGASVKLSPPSPLSIFLQPLLFPDIPPLPVGRLHCCVVSAHGVRKMSRSLSFRSVAPEIILSVGIPPEPVVPREILHALALNCGPAAAGTKRALAVHWKAQQEQSSPSPLSKELNSTYLGLALGISPSFLMRTNRIIIMAWI